MRWGVVESKGRLLDQPAPHRSTFTGGQPMPTRHSTCKILGCKRPHDSLGWCRIHYGRYRRNGDPLKTVYKARPFYESLKQTTSDDCITWPFARSRDGYGSIRVDGRTINVHRLLCLELYGPAPEGMAASHSCGNGRSGCVNPHHLRWLTCTENQAEKVKHGGSARGTRSGRCKLTESQVKEIREFLKSNTKQIEIAAMFGITRSSVGSIGSGRSWSWLH